jgi:hypothetical protein
VGLRSGVVYRRRLRVEHVRVGTGLVIAIYNFFMVNGPKAATHVGKPVRTASDRLCPMGINREKTRFDGSKRSLAVHLHQPTTVYQYQAAPVYPFDFPLSPNTILYGRVLPFRRSTVSQLATTYAQSHEERIASSADDSFGSFSLPEEEGKTPGLYYLNSKPNEIS